MTVTHSIQEIHFEDDQMILNVDGQVLSFSLEKFSSKLKAATEMERNVFQVSPSGYGIHWPLLDEDISIDALLKTI
jgi:hypothetical protein